MKKPQLAAFLVLGGVAFGCTSILGDFEVVPGASSSGNVSEAGSSGSSGSSGGEGGITPDGCVTGQKKCGDTCVDTQTSAAHCGDCNRACPNGLTCGGGNCQCPDQGSYCSGQCYPKTDREHCGPTCVVCTGTQVCDGKCIDPPPPAFDKVPRTSTGWKDLANVPLTVTVKATGQPGTKYECRSAPIAAFAGAGPAWVNCDGANGDGTSHQVPQDAGVPEGTYVTAYRYKLGAYTSPEIRTRYYVHKSLDGVATCPRQGVPLDGPHFTDQQFFDVAKTFSNQFPNAFPTNNQFPQEGNSRDDALYLGNPWIKIPFQRVARTISMGSSSQFDDDPWPPANGNYLFNERSLRHKWVMSPDRSLILVTRQYIHPKTNDCKQVFDVGNPSELSYGPPGRGVRRIECEGYVLNSQGNALCIGPNPSNPAEPRPLPFDQRLASNAGTALVPKVATFAGSTFVQATAAAFTAADVGNYIKIPDVQFGRWYRIATVGGPTQITLSEPYALGAQANIAARIAPAAALTPALVNATGYAKLHQDAHSWATGKKRIPAITGTQIPGPRPSHRTKCETPGCNAGKPWLTYLPP